MKKILVPIDFSQESEYAARFATDLAERSGAEIIFLHSIHFNNYQDFPHTSGFNLQEMITEVKTAMEEKLESFVKDLDTKAKVSTRMANIHLLDAVRDTIEEDQIGLVLMGTKGSSGWAEFFAGSNTERIVRWAECPVISVPQEASFDSIKKILAPIDLREIQDDYMKKLANLQKLFNASVEFLWVRTPHNVENIEQVTEEFSDLIRSYGFKDSYFTITNNVFPSDGILERAEGTEADMLAMATHARRGISHWLSGSITEDTVNHINLPVWTFKLDKSAESIELDSFKSATGTPEYKKIEVLAI